ncbi:1-phosphofructokinase [Bacillus sp. 31A1R]|uniref:Tagatose-6-phosphate kinase n=1 Tax=Robertmurraya mangrovi TaxID=3098077 RepID=A0ABU5J340_9BACI|nr:1-phosphofructokinase [Bacillus sp. 31A1R]MDZ5473761.1 1-phosphofructokinase [Bacillus sp. 31A1R]
MIYTLTLNPSVDYIVELDKIALGELNRTKKEAKFPGGKGINVSRVLNRLGEKSKALGFIGGFTGDYIHHYLQQEMIETDFVRVNDDTRINVKLKADAETEINANGPSISEYDFTSLKDKVGKLGHDDLLVLAGSIPSTMPDSTYEEIVQICSKNGAKFVVDAEGELLKNALPYKPFLIKPNHHELGEMFNTTFENCEDVIPYGKKLVDMGAENVIISLASKGAIFVNKEMTLISSVPEGEVKSSVGAGDSMVAGFLATYEKNKDIEEAFRYSVATGSATAFSIGLCDRKTVETLLPQVKLRRGEVQ